MNHHFKNLKLHHQTKLSEYIARGVGISKKQSKNSKTAMHLLVFSPCLCNQYSQLYIPGKKKSNKCLLFYLFLQLQCKIMF